MKKKRKPEPQKKRLHDIMPTEISLVDRHAVPEARYVLIKRNMAEATPQQIAEILGSDDDAALLAQLDKLHNALWHAEFSAAMAEQAASKIGQR